FRRALRGSAGCFVRGHKSCSTSVAQTSAFEVRGSSLDSRPRTLWQATICENLRFLQRKNRGPQKRGSALPPHTARLVKTPVATHPLPQRARVSRFESPS